jgi:Rap1a immunity proteins
MKIRVLALAAGLLVATTAQAMKGEEFARLLGAWNRVNEQKSTNRDDELGASAFTGYVRGVEDAMNGFRFCISAKATSKEQVALITKYVKEHPEELHNSATTLIVQALQPAFPCSAQ